MSILSTREWATLIWGCIFMLYVLCHREIRKSLWNVIVIFFDKKLRILWEIILLYVLTITMVFCYLPIWENIYIKDIIIWFLFSGLIYCMNAVSSEADETYIKKILKDNLKFTMILEFFMSTFTFNIWIELAIIPVITIITVMNVIAERKEEYKNVHKLLDSVLAIAGFWIFYETIKIGINEYKQLNIINTLVSFMIPIVYLILIIPLEYDPDIKPMTNRNKADYNQNHNSTSINHFYEKLLLLKDMINTETAKKIAEHRQAVMEEYLVEFLAEWEGEK